MHLTLVIFSLYLLVVLCNSCLTAMKANEDYKKNDEAFVKQKVVDNCRNFVASDNIRKELMVIEREAEKNWKRFEFLSGENVKKLVAEYLNSRGVEKLKGKLVATRKPSDGMKVSIDVIKPSPVISPTSSAIVGWRSSLQDYNMEVFGRLYISEKHTMILSPDDLIEQKFIILG